MPPTFRTAVYAGSFDPPTNGHLWMVREGVALFDRLIVAVGVNPDKDASFPIAERIVLLRESLPDVPHDRVEFAAFEGRYLVRYARAQGARFLLRGLRNGTDAEYERMLRQINADLEPDVSSVFLMPPRELAETSSSLVRGLVGPEGWREVVGRMVPPPVLRALVGRWLVRRFAALSRRLSAGWPPEGTAAALLNGAEPDGLAARLEALDRAAGSGGAAPADELAAWARHGTPTGTAARFEALAGGLLDEDLLQAVLLRLR